MTYNIAIIQEKFRGKTIIMNAWKDPLDESLMAFPQKVLDYEIQISRTLSLDATSLKLAESASAAKDNLEHFLETMYAFGELRVA